MLNKKLLIKRLFLLGCLLAPMFDFAQNKADRLVASQFAAFFNHDQPDSLFKLFSEQVQKGLPLDKTKLFVSQLKGVYGAIASTEFKSLKEGHSIYYQNFTKPGYALQVAIGKTGKIDGLFIVPADKKSADTLSPDNISLKTSTGTLYGTLTLPAGGKKVPVVLIIAGSGPTDRNCNSVLGLRSDAFLKLSQALEQNGIATVRYDKRGVAASAQALKDPGSIRFENYVADAVEWIRKLKADTRFSKVIVMGHSEGSLVGMLAANLEKTAAYISLSGAGEPVDLILGRQIKTADPGNYETAKSMIDSLKLGHTVKNIQPGLAAIFDPSTQPYLISWMLYNPQNEIKKLNQPILIIQGSTDIQVSVQDAQNLKKAKPAAQLKIIEKMNHVLREAPPDRQQNAATYNKPDLPLHPELVPVIKSFINSLPVIQHLMRDHNAPGRNNH